MGTPSESTGCKLRTEEFISRLRHFQAKKGPKINPQKTATHIVNIITGGAINSLTQDLLKENPPLQF